MHKDTPKLLDEVGHRLNGRATAGHARQRHTGPRAQAGKTDPYGHSRTVLVNMIAEADDMGAACVTLLADAGHRVVLVADTSVPALSKEFSDGRVAILPGTAMNAASLRSAIDSLPPLFRCVDATVNILHLPASRISLLDADPLPAEPNLAASFDRLLDAIRAAMPGLLASERGHVIVAALTALNDENPAGEAHASALCKALRNELNDLGLRFTRIAAGPISRKAGMNDVRGNRPRSNGMAQRVLAPADVAQAIAWTLSQPDHVAVRELVVCPSPHGHPALSSREREVLEWTACGKTAEEISRILELSVSAVNFHVKSLLVKLQCCNKTAAVARAALLGMLI